MFENNPPIMKGYNFTFTSRASYIAVGIWCLMTVVLSNAYAGNLLSFLSVPKLEPVINSLEQLIHSKNVQLVIQARSEIAIRFLVRFFLFSFLMQANRRDAIYMNLFLITTPFILTRSIKITKESQQ